MASSRCPWRRDFEGFGSNDWRQSRYYQTEGLSGAIHRAGGTVFAILRLAHPVAAGVPTVHLTRPGSLTPLFVTYPIATRGWAVSRTSIRSLAIRLLAPPVTTCAVIRASFRIFVGVAVAITTTAVSRTPIEGLTTRSVAPLVAAQFDGYLAAWQRNT